MTHGTGPYYLKVDTTALKVLLARTSGPFGSPSSPALGQASASGA
jgi:hypothetical protein